jgi:F-type H+-transporting ATPase subunit b
MHSIVAGLAANSADNSVAGRAPILPQMSELIFGIIVFLLLLWVVWRYVVPRLEQAYDERVKAIEGGIDEANQAQEEAAAAKAQYEAQLAGARAEAAKIREDANQQGAEIIAERREQANAEASRIVENAHRQTEAERQQASVELRSHVGKLSTDLASKIVGESLEDEVRQKGIVDRFLSELESGSVKPVKADS